MRTRSWLIILLLVWIGQCIPGLSPVQQASCCAIWLRPENLTALVVAEARRRALNPRVRSHPCARRRVGARKSFRRSRVLPTWKEQKTPAEGAREAWNGNAFDPQRWGLTPELSEALPDRLRGTCALYAPCFQTKTRNTSVYAYPYLSGLLRLACERNYTAIGRTASIAGENIQHFMSNSPWRIDELLEQVQKEIGATPGLEQGGVLLLDESADEAGKKKAGAGRQRNGRLNRVAMSQVGVFLAYANLTHPGKPLWTWVDGELYLQEHWFTLEMADLREKAGIPADLKFESKIEKGWKMIQRAQSRGLPFEAVAFDDLYGRSTWLRDKVNGAGKLYMADVPCNTQVYLEKPVLGVPERRPGSSGPKPKRIQVLNGIKPFAVRQVARRADTHWSRVQVRPVERGVLNDPFAVRRVWTRREGETEPVAEWLVIRREAGDRYNYSLSNASADTSRERLAWLKCQRYFVERANQDSKSEVGWDELRARKYRGWKHHLALVILATWFVAQTKWAWAQENVPDPTLAQQFAVQTLPSLSTANIRLLLRAADPLPQPTPRQAIELATGNLVNRTRSRASRLKRQKPTLNQAANVPP